MARLALPDQKPLAAAGQQHAAVVGVDRRPRRLDALDREGEARNSGFALSPVESSIDSPATPVLTARATLAATLVRLDRKAALEIGIDGQIDRARTAR